MDKIDFTFKRNGQTKSLTPYQAKVLARVGLGTYQTRDMVANRPPQQEIQDPPLLTDESKAEESTFDETPISATSMENLEELDKDQLHELAKQRGVKIHHLAGADKVRAALREISE